MGVPKFYRWISERYPNIGRVIDDNQVGLVQVLRRSIICRFLFYDERLVA